MSASSKFLEDVRAQITHLTPKCLLLQRWPHLREDLTLGLEPVARADVFQCVQELAIVLVGLVTCQSEVLVNLSSDS